MKKFVYPTCVNTFKNWLKLKPQYLYKYSELGYPRPFDITLKDGLQSLPLEEQYQINTLNKKTILDDIINKEKPFAIELGSLASPKLVPAMKDNMKFFNFAYNFYKKREITKPYFFIYLYTEKQLDNLIDADLNHNISLSTSLTNSFQYYSTKQNILSKKKEMNNIIYKLDNLCYNRDIITLPYPQIKLYINCFNSCPFEGKLDNDYIVDEICRYYTYMKPDILCLKDTCGTIDKKNFNYIINKCIENGVSPNKIALHLHYLNGKKDKTTEIIHSAIDKKITMFDVSSIVGGGFPNNNININIKNTPNNLTYELFYKSIVDYIVKY